MTTDKLVQRLSQLDTCAVSDALDSLQLTGVVTRLQPMWQCGRIAGRAVTVKLGPKGEVQSTRHLGTAAIMAASKGDVIVVENGGRMDVAGWGGLLSTAAKFREIEGVIIDGACRDIDESRKVNSRFSHVRLSQQRREVELSSIRSMSP